MISDVICLHMYDRVFCILTTFFMLCAYQADVRAFYNKLYGIATTKQNNRMMYLGLISAFTLPMIGFFDEHNFGTIHGICAVLFFLSVGLYAWILGGVMSNNKDKFPEDQWSEIDKLNTMKRTMWLSLLTLLFSISFKGSNYWLTSFAEWLTTLLFVNYFAWLSLLNNYFDSVADVSDVSPTQAPSVASERDAHSNKMGDF